MPKNKTSRKGIKNYTTTISVEKTISEIETLLTRYGAKKILKEYDDNGHITHLTFMVKFKGGFIPIKVPSDPQKVIIILNEKVDSGDLTQKYRNNKEQAERIMWRVILDWIDSQMTMIDIGQKTLLQIFFDDVCPVGSEVTLYDQLSNHGMQTYLIEDKKQKKCPPCQYESDGGPCVFCGESFAEKNTL